VLRDDLRAPAAQDLDRARAADGRLRGGDDFEDRLVEPLARLAIGSGCGRAAGRAARLVALARPPFARPPPRAPRARSGACAACTSAIDAGSQTSQQATSGAGAAASPKWRRIAARRQASDSTNAQIDRYWRQRALVASRADARQAARARPS
jgi:hypothetical protein